MAEEEENDGAPEEPKARSGVIKEYENFTSKMAKVADVVLSKGRVCCGRGRI
ncbi:MAG: hypothetical protein VX584_01955 [Actinomycetota bacterium]|nr:hypothetical protein [Actinomycetota bacterium]